VVPRLLGITALCGSLALGVSSANEWRVQDIYWADPEPAAGILMSGALTPHLSYMTSREILTRCVTTISSAYFEGLADADKSTIALNCRDFAFGSVQENAPHAEAHLLLALLGADTQNADAVIENLAAAQNLAPRDRFNVEWRLILAHRVSLWLGGALTGYDCARDLQLLETHLPGNRTLAFLRESNTSLPRECAA